MPEYIEREALIKRLEHEADCSTSLVDVLVINGLANLVRDERLAPTADVVEVKHGQWELHGNDDEPGCSYFCSSCWWNMDEDEFLDNWSHFKFCPNCGAKMDLKEGAENG